MMKTVWLLLFCFLTLPLFSGSLTVEECVRRALETHPSLKKHLYAVKQAEERVNQRKASFYPEIALKTQFSRSYQELSGRQSEAYGISLSLNQLLFNGLQRFSAYQQSKLSGNLAREELKKSAAELIYSVKETVYALNLYEKQAEVLTKGIERRKEDLIIIRLKYAGGKESLVSVREMEAEVRDAGASLLEKQEQIALIRQILNLMMGRNAEEELSVQGLNGAYESLPQGDLGRKALENSYQAQRLDLLSQIQRYEIQAIQGEYFPQISLYGGLGLSEDSFFPSKKNWNFGLSLNLPLFSGFSTEAKKKEAQHRLSELQEEKKAAEMQLSIDLRRVLTAYRILKEKIAAWQEKFQAASDSYELTRLSYQQGKLSYQWLKQKENELSSLELSKESLIYELRIKRAEIEKITRGADLEKILP